MIEVIVTKWQEGICPNCESSNVEYDEETFLNVYYQKMFDKEQIYRIICHCRDCSNLFMEYFHIPELIELIKGKCICQIIEE